MTELKRDWYRMVDAEPRGMIRIDATNRAELINQASTWNRKGWGIFWTVNEFNGPRQIPNLVRINSWVVDMDEGTKDEQRSRLNGSPLLPSYVVETKRGHQAYWNAKEATTERWNAIVLERLVPFFGADKNARDLARVLRVPGYLHLKDPTKPFLVKTVHILDVSYTELQIMQAFPVEVQDAPHRESRSTVKREAKWNGSDDFWDQVYNLDCEEALARLSGHPAVGGEQYTFRRNANGCKNIIVDGKGTSCWIDRNGRIGSSSHGGPTLAQWLRWFGLSYAEAATVIKGLFPQLDRKRGAA